MPVLDLPPEPLRHQVRLSLELPPGPLHCEKAVLTMIQ